MYPPRRRIYRYISKKIIKEYPKVRGYNLGNYMFPIDSAAIVAYLIWKMREVGVFQMALERNYIS